MLAQQQEVSCIKLKPIGELIHELPDAIQKLEEYGSQLSIITSSPAAYALLAIPPLTMSATGMEGMTEGEEVLFDQERESLAGAVVWV